MARPTVVLNQCQLRNPFQRDNIGKQHSGCTIRIEALLCRYVDSR
jgi:hypothetical protein